MEGQPKGLFSLYVLVLVPHHVTFAEIELTPWHFYIWFC